MPYDAILDYNGTLYRVEVKGSAGSRFDISRGVRSGQQIDRTANSRKRPINRNDCDFVACVDTNTNDCYIVVSVGSSRPRFVGSNEPLFVGKPEANR